MQINLLKQLIKETWHMGLKQTAFKLMQLFQGHAEHKLHPLHTILRSNHYVDASMTSRRDLLSPVVPGVIEWSHTLWKSVNYLISELKGPKNGVLFQCVGGKFNKRHDN